MSHSSQGAQSPDNARWVVPWQVVLSCLVIPGDGAAADAQMMANGGRPDADQPAEPSRHAMRRKPIPCNYLARPTANVPFQSSFPTEPGQRLVRLCSEACTDPDRITYHFALGSQLALPWLLRRCAFLTCQAAASQLQATRARCARDFPLHRSPGQSRNHHPILLRTSQLSSAQLSS